MALLGVVRVSQYSSDADSSSGERFSGGRYQQDLEGTGAR